MGESYNIELGNELPLSITLPDGASGLFPRARIYDSADTEVAGSPFDLTEVGATGRYTGASFTPTTGGTFVARFITYTDAGHTTEDTSYERDQDSYVVARTAATAAHMVVAFGDNDNDLRIKAWLDRAGPTVTSPTAITLTWYDVTGAVLFTLTQADATTSQDPDSQGVYHFQRTQALSDDSTYYATVAITDASGTVTTTRGVQTIT
jgi:hypothetical protein